jgi:2-hydroxy-3-keto-5-methylthiopentenyl-1-phosphate phosphatase
VAGVKAVRDERREKSARPSETVRGTLADLLAASSGAHVFCDFDGTISESDLVTGIARAFAPREAEAALRGIGDGCITVRAAVERMIGAIPAARFAEVARYAQERVRIRAGFAELIEACRARGWPFTVVSGGFDFFVGPALEPWRDRIGVCCNQVAEDGEYLRVVWRDVCTADCPAGGGCGLCKPAVMQRLAEPGVLRILVGDGLTDVPAASRAGFVFARDRLLLECEKRGIPHASFSTFHDVVRAFS